MASSRPFKGSLNIRNFDWLIRFFLSAIFILATSGKLIDFPTSVLSFGDWFGVPYAIAKISTILLFIIELGLALLVWRQQLSRMILTVPLSLLGITLFSYWRGIDCGCFGSLPYLSQFSFGGHLLLLIGMFLGLYYLTASPKAAKVNEDDQRFKTLRWAGLAGIVMMVSAFLTLPFTYSDSQANISTQNKTVDRAFVEAAIANRSAVIIDARSEYQYEFGHLPGAINIPYDSNNLSELIDKHALKNQALIVYCSSAHCNAAELLAEKLRGLGCTKISVYPGGWEEWSGGDWERG
ncbi:MAG: rhodanese-like domain-containing protein [Candidatus Nitrosotenuis sp.]